jgi:hypothetical protein
MADGCGDFDERSDSITRYFFWVITIGQDKLRTEIQLTILKYFNASYFH